MSILHKAIPTQTPISSFKENVMLKSIWKHNRSWAVWQSHAERTRLGLSQHRCQNRAQDYSDQRGNNKYLHPDPWGQKWIYASTTNWLRSEVSKTTIWEPFWSLVRKIYLWRKKIIKPDICIPLHRKINSKMHQKSKTIQLLGKKMREKRLKTLL